MGQVGEGGDGSLTTSDGALREGQCWVEPASPVVGSSYVIEATGLHSDREAQVEVQDASGLRVIDALTSGAGALSATAVSSQEGAGQVRVSILIGQQFRQVATCAFMVVGAQSCGDGTCSSGAGEDCESCSSDCGSCPDPTPSCGDGTCDSEESCDTCASDCGACADCTAISSNASWELCSSSSTHCEAVFHDGVSCDSLCAAVGMVCVTSYENVQNQCSADQSLPELPCDGSANHGSDYCVCELNDAVCGDTVCEAPEDCSTCAADCGSCPEPMPTCGDGSCDGDVGEDCNTCSADCGSCPEPTPSTGSREELLSRRIGFGRNAGTGSLQWPEVVVTNLNNSGSGSLREALSSSQRWITFSPSLSGTISLGASTLSVPSNVVIDGRGADVTLSTDTSARTMTLQSVQNVIVTNLKFNCGNDGIFIRNGSRDIWLDHLTLDRAVDEVFSFSGAGDNSSQRPDLITVSWTRVHQAGKVMLLSSSETNINNSPDRVTLHHNYWSESVERHPLVRFSRVHAFNNWLYHWGSSGSGQGVRVGNDAQFYSEANVYDDAYGRPGLVAENLGTYGYTISVNDLVTGDPQMEEREPSRVFTPSDHYEYTPDSASQALRDKLSQGAGWQP